MQFQKEMEDPFGLDAFLDTAKKASKRSTDDGDRRKDDRLVIASCCSDGSVATFSGMGVEVEETGREGRTMIRTEIKNPNNTIQNK